MMVVPAEILVTIPDGDIEPTATLELLQTPPAMASVNNVELPTQAFGIAEIVPAFGNGFTVIIIDVVALPQLLLTV